LKFSALIRHLPLPEIPVLGKVRIRAFPQASLFGVEKLDLSAQNPELKLRVDF
jgi:hypothetical protein